MFTKRVKAEMFIEEFGTKGSHPSLIECSDGNNYVVKHSQLGSSYHQLVNEYIAAHLSKLANINIPDYALVELIDEVFPNDVKYERGKPTGLGFGSKFLLNTSKNFTKLFSSGKLLKMGTNRFPKDFIAICVFDVWLMNSDRTENNMNLLLHETSSGFRVVAIDHAMIFSGLNYSLLNNEKNLTPAIGDTLNYSDIFSEIYYNIGIFFDEYKNSALNNISKIPDDKISAIIESVPDIWKLSKIEKSHIFNFIIYRKNKLHKLFDNVLKDAGF